MIALDFGSTAFRSLRREQHRLIQRSVAANYLPLEATPKTERLLRRTKTRYSKADDYFLAFDQEASDLSDLLQQPCLPVIDDGKLQVQDAVSRQAFAMLSQAVLPTVESSFDRDAVAIWPIAVDAQTIDFGESVLQLYGLTPHRLTSGMAIALAHLANAQYTGVIVVMGASGTEITVVHTAREVLRVVLPMGGNLLDRQFAEAFQCYQYNKTGKQYLDGISVRNERENLNLLDSDNAEQINFIEARLESAITAMESKIEHEFEGFDWEAIVRKPMQLLISGGLTQTPGCFAKLSEMVNQNCFPFAIESMDLIDQPAQSQLRGALIAGDLLTTDPQVLPFRRAA